LIRLRDIDLGILDGKEPRAKGAGRTPNGRLPARGLALDQQIGLPDILVRAGQTALTGNIGCENRSEPPHQVFAVKSNL
jgi:hypothetical protein